jgi:hypothetical protein
MARVVFEYDLKTGERLYEVQDVQGEACSDITKALMEANEVKEHEITAEMCEQADLPDYVTQGE